MKKYKYFTKNIDNQWEEIDEDIANDVIRQYFERRYIWVVGMGMFIIGMLLGIAVS